MTPEQTKTALAHCEFFQGFSPQDIDGIVTLCQERSLDAGEYVFEQGDFGEHLYVIVDGQVFLERRLDLGERQANVTIAALGRGRVLGCWSTLLDEPHVLMCSASCTKPSRVLSLNGADLRRMMAENKEFGFLMLERLAFLLRDRVQSAYGALEKI